LNFVEVLIHQKIT